MNNVLYGRLSQNKFEELRKRYLKENNKFKKKMIFHVGTGAGLYSELGAMLECMCYCHINNIQFILYADDANFSDKNGWSELFDSLGCESHDPLNKKANYRYKRYYRIKGIAVPNLLFRRFIFPIILKCRENVDYLTQDLFDKIISLKFRSSNISWPLFGMQGMVRNEYSKLSSLALRYNDETTEEIVKLIDTLNLPDHFVSIQIRGGDKTQEFTDIIDIEYCTKLIEEKISDITNIFIFTDDYRNVEYIKKMHSDWNVFTLTHPDECGYYNSKFNTLPWEIRKSNLIKLFAIVEICINSDYHIGCNGTCVNNYIRSCRIGKKYDEYTIGKAREKSSIGRIKRIFGI